MRAAAMTAGGALLPARAVPGDRTAVVRGTALATGVSTIGILPAYLAGALGPQIRAELGIGPAALGLGLSACFISQSLFSARLGRIVDRLGAIRSLRMAALATTIVASAIAAATASFAVFVVLLLATGTVNGIAQLAASRTVADSVPEHRQGVAFGIKEAGKPIATLLCGFAVPIVVLVDWRWAFVACAGLALVLLPASTGHAGERAGTAGAGRVSGRAPLALMMLAVAAALGSAVGTTAGTFLVDTVMSAGMSARSAGGLLVVGSVTSVVIRIVIGLRADRLSGGHLLRVAGLLAAGAPGFLLLAIGSGPALVLGAMLAFGGGWGWAGLLNFAVVRRNRDTAATAAGVVLAGASFGGGSGPLLFGLVAEHWSYATGWWLCSAAALLGAGVVLAARMRLLREASR
jgi:predicted MFS family arabinose efflux permease